MVDGVAGAGGGGGRWFAAPPIDSRVLGPCLGQEAKNRCGHDRHVGLQSEARATGAPWRQGGLEGQKLARVPVTSGLESGRPCGRRVTAGHSYFLLTGVSEVTWAGAWAEPHPQDTWWWWGSHSCAWRATLARTPFYQPQSQTLRAHPGPSPHLS